MGVVRHRSEVSASRHRAFAYVNDHEHVMDWMFGVKKFEPVSEVTYGLGSKYNIIINLGPKAISVTAEITEFVEVELIRLDTIKGLKATAIWRFEDIDKGTAVSVEVDYQLPGGIAGRALGAVIEPAVGQVIRHTDSALRKQLDEPS